MKQFLLPFDLEIEAGESVFTELRGKPFHYLIRVRRCRMGAQLDAITPNGSRFDLIVHTIERNCCTIKLSRPNDYALRGKNSGTSMTVIPALMKGKKMDLAIRQSVETGAAAVWPIHTDHCLVKLQSADAARIRTERWKRIAKEALQQCGGGYSTEIVPPASVSEIIQRWNNRGPIFFLHEKPLKTHGGLHQHLAERIEELALMIGPEGGFSHQEVLRLESLNAIGVFLGDRILRAETAVLYGIAVITTIIREREQWTPK